LLILNYSSEQLFNLKFAAKDLERKAKKAEKDEKTEKNKLKKVSF
jgi:charged multivesicular body protein 1